MVNQRTPKSQRKEKLGLFFAGLVAIIAVFYRFAHPFRARSVLLLIAASMFPVALAPALLLIKCGLLRLQRHQDGGRVEVISEVSKALLGALQLPVLLGAVLWVYLLFFFLGRRGSGVQQWAEQNTSLGFFCLAAPFVILAYFSIYLGSILVGLYFATITAYVSFLFAIAGLSVRGGVLSFFGVDKSKATPLAILGCSLVFASAFGAIHYGVWSWRPDQYKNLSGWQDAIYFSVTTMTTVGYGDIYPAGHLSRWLCVIEIVCGFTLLVVAVNAVLSVWIQSHQPKQLVDTSANEQEHLM